MPSSAAERRLAHLVEDLFHQVVGLRLPQFHLLEILTEIVEV
jgi:hypothetical protein